MDLQAAGCSSVITITSDESEGEEDSSGVETVEYDCPWTTDTLESEDPWSVEADDVKRQKSGEQPVVWTGADIAFTIAMQERNDTSQTLPVANKDRSGIKESADSEKIVTARNSWDEFMELNDAPSQAAAPTGTREVGTASMIVRENVKKEFNKSVEHEPLQKHRSHDDVSPVRPSGREEDKESTIVRENIQKEMSKSVEQEPLPINRLDAVDQARGSDRDVSSNRIELTGKKWTKKEVNVLKSLNSSGVPYAAIATRLGRSKFAVKRKLKRLQCGHTDYYI